MSSPDFNTSLLLLLLSSVINEKMKVSAILFFPPFQKQDPQSTFGSTTQ